MSYGKAAFHNGLGMALGLALGACAWLTSGKSEENPDLVEILNGGLLATPAGPPELGLMLANASTQTLWVSVHFRTPGGSADCLLVKELEPQAEQLYVCPQPKLQADSDYPIRITVYGDLQQTRILDTIDTRFRFDQGDIRAVQASPKS